MKDLDVEGLLCFIFTSVLIRVFLCIKDTKIPSVHCSWMFFSYYYNLVSKVSGECCTFSSSSTFSSSFILQNSRLT